MAHDPDSFDPYAGLDSGSNAKESPQDSDPFFDHVTAPNRDKKQSASPASKQEPPEVINADDDATEEDEWIDEALETEFHDYAPRATRFAAPRAEDVRVDDGGASSKAEAKAEKRSQPPAPEPAAPSPAEEDTRTPSNRKAKGSLVVAAAVVGVVAVGGGWAAVKAVSGGDDDKEQAQAQSAAPESPDEKSPSENSPSEKTAQQEPDFQAVAAKQCKSSGGTAEDGDGSSPEGAIKAFNHAYYVDKSAKEAVKYLDSAMYDSEDALQKGIDDDGNGDAYCLKIDKGQEDNQFKVTLTEFMEPAKKGDKPETRKTDQVITLAKDGKDWKVKTISVG